MRRAFLLIDSQLQTPSPYMEILYEKWIEEKTRLDIRTGSWTKIAREKENAREENRQVSEAQRRRDAAKSVQYWAFARLAGLKLWRRSFRTLARLLLPSAGSSNRLARRPSLRLLARDRKQHFRLSRNPLSPLLWWGGGPLFLRDTAAKSIH